MLGVEELLFKNIYSIIWLHLSLAATLGMFNLCCGMEDLSVAACELLAVACGT